PGRQPGLWRRLLRGAAPGGEAQPRSPPQREPYDPCGAVLRPPRRPNGVVRPVRAWLALLGVGDGRHVKDAHPDVRALHGHWRHCLGDRDRHPRLLPRLQLEPRRAPGQLPRPRWPGRRRRAHRGAASTPKTRLAYLATMRPVPISKKPRPATTRLMPSKSDSAAVRSTGSAVTPLITMNRSEKIRPLTASEVCSIK